MSNKKTPLILAAVLVIILAGAAILYPRLATEAPLAGAGGPGQGAGSSGQSDGSVSQPQVIPAPSFPLELPDGQVMELSDLLGDKPVVLNFWASTCPPCKQEMPDFQAAYEAYGDQIHFVMVNVGDAMQGETRQKADDYLAEQGYTFPVYFDQQYQGITTYGVVGFPHTYFVDGEGNLTLYAAGMISAEGLQQGLHSIAPELVPAPEGA